MVRRVALATQALFLVLLIITPHLVSAHGGGGGKKGSGRHKKPAASFKPGLKKLVGHRGKKPAAPYRRPSKPVGKVPVTIHATHIEMPRVVPHPTGPANKGNGDGIAYKGGALMTGEVNLSIIFYGQWLSQHKDLIMSFLNSFGVKGSALFNWWGIVESYQWAANRGSRGIQLKVGTPQSDDKASFGKVLTKDFIKMLVQKANSGKPNTVVVILAHKDVAVAEMCRGKCYDHGSFDGKTPWLITGNPAVECPGVCGLPFAKARYGPPGAVVKPPNGDLGVDATIINLAAGLSSVLTNPFNDGFSKKGPKTWPIEAGNACDQTFGTLASDPTGSGYNAVGELGHKFVLPGVWDPKGLSCWTPM